MHSLTLSDHLIASKSIQSSLPMSFNQQREVYPQISFQLFSETFSLIMGCPSHYSLYSGIKETSHWKHIWWRWHSKLRFGRDPWRACCCIRYRLRVWYVTKRIRSAVFEVPFVNNSFSYPKIFKKINCNTLYSWTAVRAKHCWHCWVTLYLYMLLSDKICRIYKRMSGAV